jgi:hypothetical protein
MADWLAPVMGLAGVILGMGISEYRRWREEKEQYRLMTFDKRLKTYQEALHLQDKILGSMTLYNSLTDKSEDRKESLDETMTELWDWYITNCILLDRDTNEKIVEVMLMLQEHIDVNKQINNANYKQIHELRKTIVAGIGVKHLPELPKRQNK